MAVGDSVQILTLEGVLTPMGNRPLPRRREVVGVFRLGLYEFDSTYGFVSSLVPLTNSWNFIAVTISPTNAILYLYNTNGQLSATNAIAHTVEGCSGPTFRAPS